MKKRTKTSYEEAIKIYNKYFGKCPTFNEITELWHKYSNNWKPYDGFADFLTYYTA